MLFKAMTVMLWGIAACMGAMLFWASGEVQQAEATHVALSSDLSKEHARLHVLNAEWHYLNNPEYLEKMAVRYLDVENQVDEGRIVVAGDSLPRYVEPATPSEKPEGLVLAVVSDTHNMTEIAATDDMDKKDIKAPVMPSNVSSEKEGFSAVLANWSGGR